nr:immunoglobulin light chain junction region [Macaca mulatta]MOX11258.1 immunoglobulin light chain junction region [Macaca mulatta]MOX11272.1 immunoglobulin light chain junction region [Macaca mulatta]MOX11295.1 immunoglobulin light chain junction region [Macaca mulatta]MOX11347.1 immunoglobulin light chain junction region [Macaca mulatta]
DYYCGAWDSSLTDPVLF